MESKSESDIVEHLTPAARTLPKGRA